MIVEDPRPVLTLGGLSTHAQLAVWYKIIVIEEEKVSQLRKTKN